MHDESSTVIGDDLERSIYRSSVREMSRWSKPLAFCASLVAVLGGLVVLSGAAEEDGVRAGLPSAGAYAEAIATFFRSEPDPLPLTTEEARCMADAFVDEVTAARLAALGVEPTDFAEGRGLADILGVDAVDDEAAGRVVERWRTCVDLDEVYAEFAFEGQSLTDEQRECLMGQFETLGAIDLIWRQTMTEPIDAPIDPAIEEAGQTAALACIDLSEISPG